MGQYGQGEVQKVFGKLKRVLHFFFFFVSLFPFFLVQIDYEL